MRRSFAALAPVGAGPAALLAKLLGAGGGAAAAGGGGSAALLGGATTATACKVAAVVCATAITAGGAVEVRQAHRPTRPPSASAPRRGRPPPRRREQPAPLPAPDRRDRRAAARRPGAGAPGPRRPPTPRRERAGRGGAPRRATTRSPRRRRPPSPYTGHDAPPVTVDDEPQVSLRRHARARGDRRGGRAPPRPRSATLPDDEPSRRRRRAEAARRGAAAPTPGPGAARRRHRRRPSTDAAPTAALGSAPIDRYLETLDHEELLVRRGRRSGLYTLVAVHSTARGPSLGGCRMWGYGDSRAALRDALRLSRAMTFKSAVAGLPLGGGKGVIMLPAGAPPLAPARRRDALLDFGDSVAQLGGPLRHRRGRRARPTPT